MERIFWLGIAGLILAAYIYLTYTPNSVCHLNIHEFKSGNPEYSELSAMDQSGAIINAVKKIRSISGEDYDMICKYGNDITVMPDDLEKAECESKDALACYAYQNRTIILGESSFSTGPLTRVLVHEACHGMRINEYGDFSEPVCVDMGDAYMIKESYADIEEAAQKVECRAIGSNASVVGNKTKTLAGGVCDFVNNGDIRIQKCASVSAYCCTKLGVCELGSESTEVCAEMDPRGNSSKAFSIEIDKKCEGVMFTWS